MGVDPDLFAIYGAEKPLFTRSFRPASPNPRFSVHNIAPLSVQIARYNASPTREPSMRRSAKLATVQRAERDCQKFSCRYQPTMLSYRRVVECRFNQRT